MLAPAIRHPLILLCLAGGVLFFRLGSAPLWDRDEPRNARCAQEMLERCDWITPTLNGELRAHKPVLLYWLIMVSYEVFGVNEFGARFASAALSLGTVLVTFYLGKQLFSARAGFWAGLALISSPLFVVSARAATPDATLIFCTTLGMFAFARGAIGNKRETDDSAAPRHSNWHYATYIFLGLAVLAKGPVGLVLPLLTIGLYHMAAQMPTHEPGTWRDALVRWAELVSITRVASAVKQMRLLSGIALVLLIAAPWYLAVGYATSGEFLVEFFGDHNVGRALSVKEGHSGLGPLFYLAVILAGVFPWSILTVSLMFDTFRNQRANCSDRPGIILASCWIAAYFLVFSIALTKLPSYVTPCYPAIALLLGLFVDRWWQRKQLVAPGWIGAAMGVLLFVGIGITGGLTWAAQRYSPADSWLAGLGLVVAVCGAVGAVAWWFERQRVMIVMVATAATLLTVGIHNVLLYQLGSKQQAVAMLQRASRADIPESRWISVNGLEPSWLFYANRPIDQRLLYEDNIRDLDFAAVRALATADTPTVVLVMTDDLEHLRQNLGDEVQILDHTQLLFRKYKLVLVGSQPTATRIAARRAATTY